MFKEFKEAMKQELERIQEETQLKEQIKREKFLNDLEATAELERIHEQQSQLYENRYTIPGNFITESFEAYNMDDLSRKIQAYYIDLLMKEIEYEIINVSHSSYAYKETGSHKEKLISWTETEKVNKQISNIQTALVTIKIK